MFVFGFFSKSQYEYTQCVNRTKTLHGCNDPNTLSTGFGSTKTPYTFSQTTNLVVSACLISTPPQPTAQQTIHFLGNARSHFNSSLCKPSFAQQCCTDSSVLNPSQLHKSILEINNTLFHLERLARATAICHHLPLYSSIFAQSICLLDYHTLCLITQFTQESFSQIRRLLTTRLKEQTLVSRVTEN